MNCEDCHEPLDEKRARKTTRCKECAHKRNLKNIIKHNADTKKWQQRQDPRKSREAVLAWFEAHGMSREQRMAWEEERDEFLRK